MFDVISLLRGYRRTKGPKRMPRFLSGTRQLQTAHVRGFESLFRRGTPLRRGGPRLQLLAWIVSSLVPSFSPRSRTQLLCVHTSRTPLAAQEVGRSRSRHTAAQTESFGLRNQRGSKGTEVSPESDRRPRSPQRRGGHSSIG